MLHALAIVSVLACDGADAIRAHLDREAHRAHTWDLAWGLGFGAVAIGYGAMAETRWEFGIGLDDAKVAGLWVGAVKAGIAAASHAVLPVEVERAPAATGDPCKDLEGAQHALDETARHERETYWLSIAGAVALNGGGLLWLGLHDHAWGEGVISALIGVPVAAIHTWTLPRGAMTWRIDAVATPAFTGLSISGSF